ncbi:MAG TPA: hypothetical protein VNG13_01530 [Mycobacteriales bacterium]|nr:hypothetical protein [Mycobacteriales bacterium]
MTLRGAGVSADFRRVGRVVVGVCMGGLAALAVVLLLAGVQKNAQIARLRAHGIAVDVAVSGCHGLMGGSGSNLVGYECSATFTVGRHRYVEAITGSGLHPPPALIRAITDAGDPGLLSTVRTVATERPSAQVFILPAVLFLVLVLLAGMLIRRRWHR